MAEITAVTFKPGGKVYYFAPGNGEYSVGMGVVVETARGVEYATVVIPKCEMADEKLVQPLKPILRIATQRDEETHRRNNERKGEAMETVKEKIAKYNLEMKLIDCEFAFDGSKAVFYYSAPQRVDFRELVKDLSSTFHLRIELRQVGIRDEIKLIGGIAPCGRECCCSSCMPEIKKVSIKMAKNQGLSLNPQKISGLCGRLMCCLGYENDYYAEAAKNVPKIGSDAISPDGRGMVVNVDMLKMTARLKIEDKAKDLITYRDYPVDSLKFRRQKSDDSADDAEFEEELSKLEQSVAEQAEEKPEKGDEPQNRNKFKKKKFNKNRQEENSDGAQSAQNRETKPSDRQNKNKSNRFNRGNRPNKPKNGANGGGNGAE